MKCIWCSGFPEIYAQLEGVRVCLPLVYVHSAICETVFGVVVFQRSMLNWRGSGMSAFGICAFFYM